MRPKSHLARGLLAWRLAAREVGGDPRLVGVATCATLLVVFGLSKLAELLVAFLAGFLTQLRWAHLPGALGLVAEDLVAAAGLGLLAGGLSWLLALVLRRAWARLGMAYLVLLPSVSLSLLGVALYSLYQTPLTYGQLGLMGSLADHLSSVRTNLTPLNLGLGMLLFLVVLVGTPLIGHWSAVGLDAWAAGQGRRWRPVAMICLLTMVSYLLLPGRSLLGLERNPVVELLRSGLRGAAFAGPRAELGEKPRFELNRVFDPQDRVEERLADLVHIERRPPGPMNLLLLVGESWAASQHCFLDGPAEACPRLMELKQHSLVFDSY